ncbi:hypothetical protein ACFIJ5_13670 [Haloimpatiens sp. FM7330]|uniref:hypothetical protein n=1 Tax=Haloimpatiens sp. FM7330 TaxID=3298610 RepID=UPI003630D0B5
MKRKIYNKKKFWSGIVFLLLAAISVIPIAARFNTFNTLKTIKYIVIDIFLIFFGVTDIYIGLNRKLTKEDMQNDDERENFINMKSKSSAFDITFFICTTFTLLSAIAVGITKNTLWISFFLGMALMFVTMQIASISSYFYHNKRN